MGIHNRTNGFLFDIIECLLQREVNSFYTLVRAHPRANRRSLSPALLPPFLQWVYGTQDATPLLYSQARSALLDDSQTKVVLIAHSQGGIILSLVVDWLISDLPHSALQKLEIYTFACAANHFNSPRGADGKPVIPVIEHFANGRDPVAQIGVLGWRDEERQRKGIAGFQYDRFLGKRECNRPRGFGTR